MTTEEIEAKIQKNRDEINELLFKDWPLDLIYIRIRMITSQNERLIKKLKQ